MRNQQAIGPHREREGNPEILDIGLLGFIHQHIARVCLSRVVAHLRDALRNREASVAPEVVAHNGVQWHTVLVLMVSNGVQEIVQTVVEMPTYLAFANKLFSEEKRADIVALVAADPECGDMIR